jgi:hypothetical protein
MVGPDREILLKLILNCQTSLATYVPKRVLPDHGDFPLPVPVEKTVATLFPVPSVRSWPGSRPHFWSRPKPSTAQVRGGQADQNVQSFLDYRESVAVTVKYYTTNTVKVDKRVPLIKKKNVLLGSDKLGH